MKDCPEIYGIVRAAVYARADFEQAATAMGAFPDA
jgi:hypothetical protein